MHAFWPWELMCDLWAREGPPASERAEQQARELAHHTWQITGSKCRVGGYLERAGLRPGTQPTWVPLPSPQISLLPRQALLTPLLPKHRQQTCQSEPSRAPWCHVTPICKTLQWLPRAHWMKTKLLQLPWVLDVLLFPTHRLSKFNSTHSHAIVGVDYLQLPPWTVWPWARCLNSLCFTPFT